MLAESIRLRLTPPVQYLLRLGDTALIHAQRLAEWSGHGPVLEEDIALSNMALDVLGVARALLTRAGQLEGQGFDEDQLAFLRDENQFFNATLAEQPMRKSSAHASGGDFADTVLRNWMLSTWFELIFERALGSSDAELAGIAAKGVKESRYHRRHAADWIVRLGDGTDESHARMQAAVEQAWPYAAELFAADAVDEAAAASGFGPSRADLRGPWRQAFAALLAEATLVPPADTPFRSTGMQAVHSEHLGYMLAEMQALQRRHPGGRW